MAHETGIRGYTLESESDAMTGEQIEITIHAAKVFLKEHNSFDREIVYEVHEAIKGEDQGSKIEIIQEETIFDNKLCDDQKSNRIEDGVMVVGDESKSEQIDAPKVDTSTRIEDQLNHSTIKNSESIKDAKDDQNVGILGDKLSDLNEPEQLESRVHKSLKISEHPEIHAFLKDTDAVISYESSSVHLDAFFARYGEEKVVKDELEFGVDGHLISDSFKFVGVSKSSYSPASSLLVKSVLNVWISNKLPIFLMKPSRDRIELICSPTIKIHQMNLIKRSISEFEWKVSK